MSPNTAKPFRLALVTRLRTPNKGNEALSSECIRALEHDRRVARVELLERTPPYTRRFDSAQLRRALSLQELVAKWATAALRLEQSADRPIEPLAHHVVLDERDLPKPGALLELKKRLALRSRLARLGWHDSSYGRRLRLIRECGNLVLNAAGEFWETANDIPLRHLLDMYFAQAIGCRTAIINHTFSIRDPAILELAKMVYPALDYISVRDEQSRSAIESLGVTAGRIAVAADLVFLTEAGAAPYEPQTRVALCPNAALRGSLERQWGSLVEALMARGITCSLCSNDFPTDGELIERLSRRFGLAVVGRGLDYRAYSGLLGTFGAVVSSRLHTGILAIVANTPVVPVEGLTFKITAAMAEIGNPFPAVEFDESGWVDKAIAMIETALKEGGSARSATAEVASRQRQVAERNVSELVSAVLPAAQVARAAATRIPLGSRSLG